jgi:hypothetical protein
MKCSLTCIYLFGGIIAETGNVKFYHFGAFLFSHKFFLLNCGCKTTELPVFLILSWKTKRNACYVWKSRKISFDFETILLSLQAPGVSYLTCLFFFTTVEIACVTKVNTWNLSNYRCITFLNTNRLSLKGYKVFVLGKRIPVFSRMQPESVYNLGGSGLYISTALWDLLYIQNQPQCFRGLLGASAATTNGPTPSSHAWNFCLCGINSCSLFSWTCLIK